LALSRLCLTCLPVGYSACPSTTGRPEALVRLGAESPLSESRHGVSVHFAPTSVDPRRTCLTLLLASLSVGRAYRASSAAIAPPSSTISQDVPGKSTFPDRAPRTIQTG